MRKIKSIDQIAQLIEKHNLDIFIHSSCSEYVQVHEFEPLELIVRESEPPRFLYRLLQGEARVSPSSEDGRSALLDYIKPMDLLGDIEYFFSDDNYHSVTALTRCVFLAIPLRHIDTYFNDNVQFYKFLCMNLARKIRSSSIKHSRSLLYPMKNRIAKHIYDMSVFRNSSVIKLKFNQTAEYLGISSRHFRRILSEFEVENILERKHSEIHILDMDKLHGYVTYK